ncbi:hypothetical protein CBB_2965 [Clostridium botulinum Bf]|uniref:Uncharacterized protein n=2 Tax=Clostridium botulinum TaxID=1491 RepID=C1FU91_CLOBJ|nr:hypothetical protein CLM_3058 [Clostridium botulinum A2 str. Kyoto]ACQ51668.1 hypothetical protein CLJ_B2924 [Clostridium botulinum Ba4 str. 657]EDT85586.1 hypothetical protein CBB_2965 [Clostridium botulinum Bf]
MKWKCDFSHIKCELKKTFGVVFLKIISTSLMENKVNLKLKFIKLYKTK